VDQRFCHSKVKTKATSGNATKVLVENASGTEKTKPTVGNATKKLKELEEVAALAESGKEKRKQHRGTLVRS
jgi:hypothetical protein